MVKSESRYTILRDRKTLYYVVHKITGLKHSKLALPYYKARAQKRALDSIYSGKGLNEFDEEGAGFLDSIKEGAKNVYGRIKGFVTGVRDDYQPKVRKLLAEIKDDKITSCIIIRTPIDKAVGMLVNAITLGKMAEFKKQVGFDEVFHLYMVVTLESGKMIRIEKNAELDIQEVGGINEAYDNNSMTVDLHGMTVPTLLDNTHKMMGDRKFYDYNPLTNNCQSFILEVLKANGHSRMGINKFVKQDLTKLGEQLSGTTKDIMTGITTLGKRVQILTSGAGLEKLK